MSELTKNAITRQLTALGPSGAVFEVGALWPKPANGPRKIFTREWSLDECVRCIPALRAWNTQGAAIYVRPLVPLGVVLLDDVKRATIEDMTAAGFPPACVVETSTGNYQCWVRLVRNEEKKPIETRLLSRAVRLLVERFGADPASADWRHYGRLGGFTNRKPQYERGGRFPFVKVYQATGEVSPNGREHLRAARRELEAETAERIAAATWSRIDPAAPAPGEPLTTTAPEPSGPLGSYAQRRAAILARNAAAWWIDNPDENIIDFWIVCEMLAGGWSDAAICEVISQRPGIEQKHRIADYLDRTLKAARKRLLFPAPDSSDTGT